GSSNNNEYLVNIRCKEWCQLIKIRKKSKNEVELKAPLLAYTKEKDLHLNYNTSQEVSVEIIADNLESAIIQRVVKNKKIERELVNTFEKLKEEEIIRYYTDGALAGSSRELESGRMGADWI